MPVHNIRIQIPHDADDDSGEDDMEEEDQEDVPDRDQVKKYSSLMLEKANKKQKRQRKKKSGEASGAAEESELPLGVWLLSLHSERSASQHMASDPCPCCFESGKQTVTQAHGTSRCCRCPYHPHRPWLSSRTPHPCRPRVLSSTSRTRPMRTTSTWRSWRRRLIYLWLGSLG